VLIGHFAARRDGRGAEAAAFLDDAALKCNIWEWPYPIVKYLRGEIDQSALLAGATDNHSMSMVRCFLGLEALQGGNAKTAGEHFRWVQKNGDASSPQFSISVAELARLDGN
jgi:hypothetical protein